MTTVRRSAGTAAAQRRSAVGYLVVRVTGVLLAVLVTGHFAVTHIVNDVAATDSSFVAQRWSSALWVVWDGLLLACALAHGASGIQMAVNDYAAPRRRRRWRAALVAFTTTLFALGAAVLAVSAGR